MRNKNNLLIIKLKHSGSVWRKVIRQKYPGNVMTSRTNLNVPELILPAGAVSNGVRVKEKEKKKDKDKGKQSRKDSSAPAEGEVISTTLKIEKKSLIELSSYLARTISKDF